MDSTSSFQAMEKVSRVCTWIYYGFLGAVWLFFTVFATVMVWWIKVHYWMSVLLFLLSLAIPLIGVFVTWLLLVGRKRGTSKLTQQLLQRHGGSVRGADWRNLFRTDCWEGTMLDRRVSVMYARIPRRTMVQQFISGQYDGGALLSAFLDSREYWQMGRGRFATQTVRVKLPADTPALPLIIISGRTRLGAAAGRHLSGGMKEMTFTSDPMAQAFIISSNDSLVAGPRLASTAFRQNLFAAAAWCAPMLESVRIQENEAVFSGYVVPGSGPEQLETLVGYLSSLGGMPEQKG